MQHFFLWKERKKQINFALVLKNLILPRKVYAAFWEKCSTFFKKKKNEKLN